MTVPTAAPAVVVQRLPGHVALVTLNRPEVRNAINGALTRALDAAVTETENDPDVRAVVLTGAGRDFCAGADLKAVSAGEDSNALRTDRGGFAGFEHVPRTKPWVAAVNGRALAGGCELMLACDVVVASHDSAFGVPEVKRGLAAGAGGVTRLPRALPPNIALELILTGEPLDAARAQLFGLVNRLVAADRVVDEALTLARQIAANAPFAVRESLRVARFAIQPAQEQLREMNSELWTRIVNSEDAKEGPRAFVEKRAPRWTGR